MLGTSWWDPGSFCLCGNPLVFNLCQTRRHSALLPRSGAIWALCCDGKQTARFGGTLVGPPAPEPWCVLQASSSGRPRDPAHHEEGGVYRLRPEPQDQAPQPGTRSQEGWSSHRARIHLGASRGARGGREVTFSASQVDNSEVTAFPEQPQQVPGGAGISPLGWSRSSTDNWLCGGKGPSSPGGRVRARPSPLGKHGRVSPAAPL